MGNVHTSMMPDRMKLVVIRQTGKQYNAVKTQLYRKDINDIIIATDAGREGELVAAGFLTKRTVINQSADCGFLQLQTKLSKKDSEI